MGDVEDADAFGAEVAHHAEKLIGFVLRETRCRLVHDEDAGIDAEGFGYLNKLLMANRQVGNDGVGGAVEADAIEDLCSVVAQTRFVDEAESSRLAAEINVGGDGGVAGGIQF